jgi:hypothetical protein
VAAGGELTGADYFIENRSNCNLIVFNVRRGRQAAGWIEGRAGLDRPGSGTAAAWL